MDKKPEKLVPEVRFKGFTDDWEQRELGEIANVGDGLHGTPKYEDEGEYYFINGNNLIEGRIQFTEETKHVSYSELSDNDKALNNLTLLMSINGTIGQLAFYSNESIKLGKSVAYIRFGNLAILSFYYGVLMTSNTQQYFNRRVTGTTIKNLGLNEIRNFKYPIPNGNEQDKIGKLIKSLDTLITLQQRKLEQLKQLKKAMLQQLFVDKNCKQPILRFKNFNDNWEERKLSDIANYRNGKAHEQYIDINGIYTVVNSKFISTNGKVKKFSNKPIELLKKGEIAFVLSDVPNGKALAKTYLIDSDNKYSLNQRIAGITPSSDINSYFLYILMNRNRYFLKFDDGVGQTNLSKKDIEEFKENYPLFDEQQKIANLFSKIQTLITRQQNKLTQLIALKKYLLQNLFI